MQEYQKGQIDMLRRVIEDMEVRKNNILNAIQYKIVEAKTIGDIKSELEKDKIIIDELTHIIRTYEDMIANNSVVFEYELPF